MFSSSQGHPSKPSNGDHAGHMVLRDPVGLVLVVSDGVSSHDHDWLASETACAASLRSLSETAGERGDQLHLAMAAAHDAVQSLRDSAKGAMATLILAAYDESQGSCQFFSVGDSRVYKVGGFGVEVLTRDDSRSLIIKQNGKPVLRDGAVVSCQALTQAVGQLTPLDMRIRSVNLKPGEMLALVTDGCYELPGFLQRLEDIQKHSDLETAAQSLIMDHHLANGADDGTLALIRRVDCPDALRKSYLDAFDNDLSLSDSQFIGHTMMGVITEYMVECARIPEPENLLRALSFLKKERLIPGREAVLNILNEFKNDNRPEAVLAFRKIRELITGF